MNLEAQKQIAEMLVAEGIVTNDHIMFALKEAENTGMFFAEILSSRMPENEERIVRTISSRVGIAYVEFNEITVETDALELVDAKICGKEGLIPLYTTNNSITIAVSNPADNEVFDKIEASCDLKVRPVLALYTGIRKAINDKYGETKHNNENQKSEEVITDLRSSQRTEEEPHHDELKKQASSVVVVDLVNEIIKKAVDVGASDIHIEPSRKEFLCRYRLDGVLQLMQKIPVGHKAAVISRIKVMSRIDIAEKRLPQDGRIRLFISERDVDLRVSTFPTIHGENVVIRILDRSGGIITLDELGFANQNLDLFKEMIKRPYGIILVTGPTGSGKSTTLYASLGMVNALESNVITLEDPVEYELPHVRQSQVNTKAGLTFASGLRSILRQDPDIIMIGEIRDKETADIAIHAALTGHLVFSTLHTNDSASALTRLVNMGVEPFLAASSIVGILAQRLVRVTCPDCREAYTPDEALIEKYSLEAGKKYTFYKEKGCEKCAMRGYIGRIGLFELLLPDEKIKHLITKKSPAIDIHEQALSNGMTTLRDAGMEKVIEGVTTLSEVLRVTEEG